LSGEFCDEPFPQGTEHPGTLNILKKGCRCGLPETDFHLFFLCPFAKAAWFSNPWFLRSEAFVQNANSFDAVLLSLLSSGHLEASLASLATFLCCLWKARNDQLFDRKKIKPEQVALHSKALLQDLEVYPLMPRTDATPLVTNSQRVPNPGDGLGLL
jgi:hypothetical protein